MSRPALALLVAVPFLALGIALFALRDGPHRPAVDALDARAPHVDLVAPSAALVEPVASEPAAPAATAERTTAEVVVDPDAVPDDALWVVGRVVFPPGTPRDERAFVVARGKKYGGSTSHRFEVGENGEFRAAFAPKTTKGALDVVGRYLYLAESVKLDPAAQPSDVVLRPELGGCVRVRLVPSPLALARTPDYASASVELFSADVYGANPARPPRATSDARGVAEIGGVVANKPWMVHVQFAGFAGERTTGVSPKPGEIVERDVALTAATLVRGVVLDARGEPVEGAMLRVEVRAGNDTSSSMGESSDAQGRFELHASGAGEMTIHAERAGHLAGKAGPFELSEGGERAGVELRLADGLSIRGVVRWPDGKPAEEAAVSLVLHGTQRWYGGADSAPSVRSGADGTFEFKGLVEGAYALGARARSERAEGEPRAWWNGRVESVDAGARDVVILLAAGSTITGRVVDDLGMAVRGCRVRLKPSQTVEVGRRAVSARSHGEDGAFELESVPDGEYVLVAELRAGVESAGVLCSMPRDAGRSFDLVLPRPANVAGRVVDVDGSPAAGARVEIRRKGTERYQAARTATSASDGAFRLEDVAAGAHVLVATREGRVESAEHELDVVPGRDVAEVALALRRGGIVEGRVLDRDDRSIAGRRVVAGGFGPYGQLEAATDANGEFRITDVPPGRIEVMTWSDSDTDDYLHASVALEEGGTARVDLGGASKGAYVVRGVVTAGGPVAAARVTFNAMGPAASQDDRNRTAVTDGSGRYEMRVATIGSYSVGVMSRENGTVWKRVDLADAPTQVVDVELGSARITGRVVDHDGRPVAEARVRVEPNVRSFTGDAQSTSDDETAADGTFALRGLLPGTYVLRADPQRWSADASARLASAQIDGLEVAAGSSREVEVRLAKGGSLVVRAVDVEGRPIAGANVRLAPRDGAHAMPTDAAGATRFDGLTPGRVTITAATHELVEREAATADVAVEGANEATVVLVAGGRFAVKLLDSRGAALASAMHYPVEVLDATGARVRGTMRRDAGDSTSFGPVLPGTYTVRVRFGAKKTEATVSVAAGTEREVVLREPD